MRCTDCRIVQKVLFLDINEYVVATYFTADPDMPQDTVYDQRNESHGCIIQASWSAPTNINVTDVTKYMMLVNGANLVNETNTNNQKLTLTSYPVCACDTYRVSVKAVNRCGHAGRSTNITILDLPSRRLPERDCGDSAYITTQSTRDGITDGQVKLDNPGDLNFLFQHIFIMLQSRYRLLKINDLHLSLPKSFP